MHLRILLSLAAAALVTSRPALAGAPLDAPTYLDFTSSPAERAGTVVLTASDSFAAERGYGWTMPPAGSFALPQFGGVRSAALTDGVSGDDYTLRVALADRRWTVIAFLDDGYHDAHTVEIEADGRRVAHNPRVFGLESEPEAGPINRYRVAEFIVPHGGTVDLRFRQKEGQARLLAVQLLPMDWVENDLTRWLRRQVDDAGRYDFSRSLDILRAELERHGRTPELAAACAYWKAQLDLLGEAEHWHRLGGWDEISAQTRSSMFVRYKIAVALLDPLVEHTDGDAFPLRDRARWLRTRLLYWLWAEQHMALDEQAFRADLAVLRAKYPADRLMAMYAGEKMADGGAAVAVPPIAAAPGWSTAELEALQRLRDVAHYWIDERQIPNGEFGGKTDDDVELLRWWPVLMFTGDTKVRDGFNRLAEGVWFSPRVHLGYSRVARDVEHSAEFVSDTVPMMALMTRDPEWIRRLGFSFEHMRDLWTGHNAHGDLHFKSAWLGATEILTEAPRNRDLSMNARAAKAVRYYAWLTGDPAAGGLLRDWSLAWAKAAAGTAKGKPLGLFPASLRWPDAVVNGDEPQWHKAAMFWPYYDWQGDGRLYDQLLFSWLGGHDPALLEPLQATLTLLEKYADAGSALDAAEGSPAWSAARLEASGEFWNVVAQWRFETGDTRHDAFLARHGPPYLRYRLTGDAAPLAPAIEATLLDVLRSNRPLRTREVLFTDRVVVSQDVGNADGADLLTAMLTGCHTAEGMSPYFHVAWEGTPAGFTALVTSTGADHVAADVFLHQREPGVVTARFFRLPPGSYRLTVADGTKRLLDRAETVRGPDHRAALVVPGATPVSIRIARVAAP